MVVVDGTVALWATASRRWMPWSSPRSASPPVQERNEVADIVLRPRTLQPGRDSVDRDVACTQLVGEGGRDDVEAGHVDDRAPVAQLTRRLLIDEGRAPDRRVHDDVDTTECSCRLVEQTLDVDLVADVGANGDRRSVRGKDLRDRGFCSALIPQVDHHQGVATARELQRELAPRPTRAAGDDRHRIVSHRRDHAGTLAGLAPCRTRGSPGRHPRPGTRLRDSGEESLDVSWVPSP